MGNDTTTAAEAADPLAVGIEEIELPPDEVMDQMLEDEVGDAARVEAAKRAPAAPVEVETLDFVDERSTRVPLTFRFRREGAVVDAIVVTRPTGHQIAEFAKTCMDDGGGYDRYELYEVMTGLPAPVLRGLDQDDGLAVAEACGRFLPRVLQDAS